LYTLQTRPEAVKVCSLCYCFREVVPTSDGAGEKEYLYMFFEVAICLYLCSPLVRVSLLFKYVFGSIVMIEDIEHVQKRAARFVYHNYRSKEPGCVTNMLDALNWEPLSQRRAKNRVIMLYKIINNQVTIDPNTYLNKSDTRTRGEHKYKQIATSGGNCIPSKPDLKLSRSGACPTATGR
jgi:hypothetical protein